MTRSQERYDIQRKQRAKRVAKLRSAGLTVKETALEVGCGREQVRALQLLGERLLSLDENKP
ncbi:hypothetical protein SAMN03159444_00130 [Pseudomonas sp. NFACC02]|nr:hypothetical protein SAMN03159444_00130 [Pseudomonas sp. NFACC02]